MPEFLRQSTVRAGDNHQAISRRDKLEWGIASSVLLAALARSVQLLVDTVVILIYDFGDDIHLVAELALEYQSLVWIFPVAFAAFTIHALRKPSVSQHLQIRAVRLMKIVAALSVLCLLVIWTFLALTDPTIIVGHGGM